MANEPYIQRVAIVPTLIEELTQDANRKLDSLRALSKLYSRSDDSIPSILDEMIAGYIQRNIVSCAMRCCGKRGEKVLLHLLENHRNHRIR